MDRNRRFAAMAEGDAEPLMELAEEVLSGSDVEVLTRPHPGTLMLRVREPVGGGVFNAGELLATEARVALGRAQGYAMRLGWQPTETLAAAILDAAMEAGHAITPRIAECLGAIEARLDQDRRAAWQEVAPTRVSFDEMA